MPRAACGRMEDTRGREQVEIGGWVGDLNVQRGGIKAETHDTKSISASRRDRATLYRTALDTQRRRGCASRRAAARRDACSGSPFPTGGREAAATSLARSKMGASDGGSDSERAEEVGEAEVVEEGAVEEGGGGARGVNGITGLPPYEGMTSAVSEEEKGDGSGADANASASV